MDRSHTPAPQHPTAVRVVGSAALDLLLPAVAGERGEPSTAPPTRPTVSEASVFRKPQNGRRVGGEPQTHPTADAHPGHRSPLSQTELEPSSAGSSDLPIPAARRGDREAQPRLEHRYYLPSDAWRLSLSGRGDGLVQPLRAQLGTLQYDGNRFLPDGAGRRVSFRPARNLELRSGFPVHLGRLFGSAQKPRHRDQHGWPRARARQRFHRTAVALAQVRADLSRRLRHGPRTVSGAGKLFPLLQSPAPAPGARLSDAGRFVPAQTPKEKIIFLMGDAVPQTPWDLSLSFSRMDVFCFTANGTCRTIEGLDRKIGQRRDATRAPIQARNGWRPHGRRLGQPLHHLRTPEILSKRWGPPQSILLEGTQHSVVKFCSLIRDKYILVFWNGAELAYQITVVLAVLI